MKKFLLLFSLIILPAQAFQDCVITTDGKLSDISIEHNDIIDVYPMFTIMNEKNTLFVQPLKEGKTRLCVLKNNKNIVMFDVEVKPNETIISDEEGFEILSIDTPPEIANDEDFELDSPPTLEEVK